MCERYGRSDLQGLSTKLRSIRIYAIFLFQICSTKYSHILWGRKPVVRLEEGQVGSSMGLVTKLGARGPDTEERSLTQSF